MSVRGVEKGLPIFSSCLFNLRHFDLGNAVLPPGGVARGQRDFTALGDRVTTQFRRYGILFTSIDNFENKRKTLTKQMTVLQGKVENHKRWNDRQQTRR